MGTSSSSVRRYDGILRINNITDERFNVLFFSVLIVNNDNSFFTQVRDRIRRRLYLGMFKYTYRYIIEIVVYESYGAEFE